ncbi:Ig-like domain-containing protein [Blastopirellula sp. JC732]|uniref:Ig-like domain-containing protein n=1 Tax=Blastopirellula sediminis TaxID=2894196 RepID=A0A9X1SHR5_9BACT|nr:Ig-like domain-containing protein [Blastopirellula sediminis]MCC9607773.1 Ig-like domain-containing protein [Blastopirellula sediminis]MCC9627434.1 Ig-like domain-containing protein [Blastopirellula sediminis]
MGSERLEERRVMDASAPNFDLSGVEPETAYVGDQYSLDLMSAGGTISEGQFTFVLDPDPDQTPSGATISPDGVLNWTPSMDQVGSHTIRVIAMNNESPMKGDFESITIEVQVGSPTVDLNGEDAEGLDFQTTFQYGQGPVSVADSDMTVADPNNETLMSATVTITNLADGAAESLLVDTEGTSITAEYADGVLQLTGEASLEEYQQVLRSVRYSNSSSTADVTPRVIEFTVNDGVSDSEVATSTVNVNLPPNLATIADQTLDAGTELMFEISATDPNPADELSFMIDPESPTFVSLIQEVGSRTAQLLLTPGIDVTPGIFSISILVFDNAGLADVESFFVEVTANEAPVSLDDAYMTNEDVALNVAAPGVLENDTDADGDPIVVTEVNGEAANVGTQITLDSGALLTLNADGSFDYDPNGMFASLAEGETAEETFTYTIADIAGQVSTSSVVITIAGVNNAPVSADDAYETTEDTAISISAPGVLENDTDADGDSLTVVDINGEAASVGTQITLDSGALLTLNADGSFDYDPNGAFASLTEGESAEDSFTYTAADSSGLMSTSTVVIAIAGIDHTPVSADDAYETTEDTALNISAPGVLENDTDADGDSLMVVDINGEAANVGTQITLDSGALLTLNADGSFDYDPNGAFAALAEGETAEESFTYTAADSSGLMSTSTVIITIAGVNNAPVSADDAYETAEDTALNISAPGVLENDTDADGDSLTVVDINGEAANVGSQITLDSGALLTLNADGSFDYDPNGAFASLAEGETAEDSFTYTAADSSGLMSTSTVVVTIAGVNNAPVSSDDAYETDEDTAFNIAAPGVLENDTDADGDALTVVDINGEAANVGTQITLDSGALVTLNADGSFDYDPNGAFASLAEGETAEDSFTYTAADGIGLMSSSTVVITIAGIDHSPVSADDAYETSEDTALNIASPGVLENDVDADGDSLMVVDINGEPANVGTQIALDSGALLTLNADGSFDYDPNGAFASLAEGETAEESFTYSVADGSGLMSSSTVVITITGVNNAPVGTDDAYQVEEDSTLNIPAPGVLENDTDADGDSLTVLEINGEPASVGMQITLDSGALLTLNADGSFDYDPNGMFASLSSEETAFDSFAYTATDSSGLTSSSMVSITILGVDHAPVSSDDAYETSEDTALNIAMPGVLENDTDLDTDSLTVLDINGEAASVGTQIMLDSGALLTLNADGSFDYDPNGMFADLMEGETAEESFTYTATDSSGLTSTSTVVITITGVDHAPVSSDDAYETDEDTALNIAALGVLENDVDADGDVLSVLEVNGQSAAVGSQITLDSGVLLTLNADGSFDYDPNGAFASLAEGETAEESFTYTAVDGSGLTSTSTVVITITGIDHAPVSADDAFEVAEDEMLSIIAAGVLDNDTDADGDSLSVVDVNGETVSVGSQITLDSGALLTLNADGSFDYDPNGSFASLAEGETAEESFTYSVADGSGLMSTSTVVITITGVDHAPVTSDDAYETAEDAPLSIPAAGVLENDTDADGDSLMVVDINGEAANVGTQITLDSGALLTLNADGSFDYDPNGAFASLAEGETAEESFTYTATDSSGLTSTSTVAITITGVNHAPEAVEDFYETTEDVVLNVEAPGVLGNDLDADGDSLTVVEMNGQAANVGVPIMIESGALVTLNADGSLVYDPNGRFASLAEGETAPDMITYVVADSSGQTSFGVVRITITGVNNAPVTADDGYETAEDVVLNVPAPGVLENDVDADRDALSVVEVNGEAVSVGSQITLDSGALLTLNADGSFDYDPNGVFNDLVDGETVEDSFSYTAADGSGLTSTSTVAITIQGVTNLIVEADEYVTDEDSPLSISAPGVLGNDTGAASIVMVNGEAVNVGAQITLASGALLTVNADGSFDYDPNGSFEALRAGEQTLDSFSYVADDGSGTTDVGTVSIVVNGVNDAPIAADDAFSTDESTALSIVPVGVMFNDTDTEGTHMTISAVNGAPADVGAPIVLASGALLTLNADGSFDYDPNGMFDDMSSGETATDSFTYTISDEDGGEDTATVTLTINGLDTDNGTNLPPLNHVPGTQTIAAGLSLVFGSTNGNAISVSDPDAAGAFVQVTISVQHGTLQLASLNAQRIMLVGSFEQISHLMDGLVYTPNDGFTGTDTFTINSNDRGATGTGSPRSDIDTFDIVVTPSEAVEEVFADSELLDDMLFS